MNNLFDDIEFLEEDIEPVKKQAKQPKSKTKKEGNNDESNETEINKEEKNVKTKHTYPFIIHYAAQNINTDHIFENGKEYTEDEITKAMFNHQFYEFSGSVKYDYRKEENVLVPIFQQHKKG